MTKAINRTSEQQAYRDDLAKKLNEFRYQGDEGREIAEVFLQKEKSSDLYKKAKEGISIEQLSAQVDYELSHGTADSIHEIIQICNKNNVELTEEQKKKIKEKILARYQFDDKLFDLDEDALYLLMQNIKQFSQEDKEKVVKRAVFKYCIREANYSPKEDFKRGLYRCIESSRGIRKGNWYNEIIYYETFSAGENIKPIIMESLKESKNEVFILEMLAFLQKRGYLNISKIPKNCKSILSNPDKLKDAIKGYGYESEIKYAILALDKLGIKTTINTLSYRKLEKEQYETGKDIDPSAQIKDIFGEDIFDRVLNEGGKNLKFLVRLVGSKKFRKQLDDKYKTPAFVKANLKKLRPLLVGGGWKWLLKNAKKDSEKFDISMITLDIDGISDFDETLLSNLSLIKEHTNFLATSPEKIWKLVYIYKGCFERYHIEYWCNAYLVLREMNGNLPKEYLKGLLHIIGTISFFHDEKGQKFLKNYASAIMQDIYATNDTELIKELGSRLGQIEDYVSQEEINIAIKKWISRISTQEDFSNFYRRIRQGGRDKTEKFNIMCVIEYVLFGKVYSNHKEIPKNIYSTLIKSGKIDTSRGPLQKVGPSIDIDKNDLEKLLGYYHKMLEDEEENRRRYEKAEREEEKELDRLEKEREKLEQEVIKNREKGDVILNYTEREQKFVLSINKEKRKLQFLSENLDYHYMIHKKYVMDGECVGGGRVKMDEKTKTIELYGSSTSYGPVGKEYKDVMRKMLEKKFPDYKIIISQ